ncbi:MAG: ComF family protein [Candidatus Omnitrophota bacterium]
MTESVLAIAKNLVNLVYPLRCASCGKGLSPMDESGVCALCIGQVRRNPKPHLAGQGFDRAYSALLYEGVLKELVHAFKYKRRISLSKLFARLLTEFINNNPEITDNVDLVTFVPLHNSRLRKREFNQSKLLASRISDEFKIPLADTLDKVKATRSQFELSRTERLVNLGGAFRIRRGGDTVRGKSVLLVDDVLTTGATLDRCARVLKAAGAVEVRCLTLARGA